jgi:hypothetical protein
MIHLTSIEGVPIDLEPEEIKEVRTLGDGAIVFLNDGPPVRALQGMPWITALWKAGVSHEPLRQARGSSRSRAPD